MRAEPISSTLSIANSLISTRRLDHFVRSLLLLVQIRRPRLSKIVSELKRRFAIWRHSKVFEDAIDRLALIQKDYASLLLEQATLPKDKLSATDQSKLTRLTTLLQSQAAEFGFSTFSASELEISNDSYRPEKEGFEIGFETSASDAIRLKWAYQLSLLELASSFRTNHPELLIFDEPRQQSSSKVSFESLLRRASKARDRGQQVVFSTSEDLESLRQITSSMKCHEEIFAGYILQKL